MDDVRNRPMSRAAFVLLQQAACPIALGQIGQWNDNGVVKTRQADGTDTAGGGSAQQSVQALAADMVVTAALPANTYANGTAGQGATLTANANGQLAAQDGQTPSAGKILLVTGEVSGLKNGIYLVTDRGSASTPYILTRVAAWDTTDEMKDGTLFVIKAGTVNADTTWKYTGADSPTVGTTALTFLLDPGVMETFTDQTVTGAKTFADGKLKQNNAAGTFASTLASLATAARTVTLPDADLTVAQDSLVAHLAGTETLTGAKKFTTLLLQVLNGAATFVSKFASNATADRTVTFPDAAGTVGLLDTNPSHVQPSGPAPLAGASGLAADVGHVHQLDVTSTRFAIFTGIDSTGGASHVNVAALKVGDQVIGIVNLTDDVDGTAKYEAAVTVNGQLQQPQASGDLSTKKFAAFFIAKS